jgi:O-antigen/teichoic acid export membrane protein
MTSHKRDQKVVAAAGSGVFQRLVQIGCTLLLMPLVLRTLGPADFGKWGAAASLAWLSGLVDIGIGTALVTLVAQSMARDQVEEARTQIAGALGVGSGLAAIMLCLALIAWIFGASQGNSAAYLIALVGLAVNVPLHSANNVWMALQKGYVSGFWELVQTVLTTGALVAATAFTADVRIYVALVYAGLVLANLGSLVHLFWYHAELRPKTLHVIPAAMRAVTASGLLYFVLGITGGLSFMLDNVLALQLLGPEASARMTIAMRICMTAVGILVVMSQPFWPAFTEAAHQGDRRWIRTNLLRGTAMMVGISAAGSIILLTFGERLLRFWLHTNLGIGRGLLWAISIWVITQSFVRIPSLLLNGLSLIRFQIAVFGVAALVALSLKFALAPVLGVSGILWATGVAVLFIVAPASIWRICRWANASEKNSEQKIESLGAKLNAQRQF